MSIDVNAASGSSGHPNLSVYLTRQILDLISKEDLRSGDRLPSIRVLSERFAVASPTMREALGRLQANGVVEIRHGSGVYVRSDRERVVISNPNHGEINPDTILHLLDARLLIEPHLAESAARRISDDEVAELESILEEASQQLDGCNDKALHRANWNFHRAVATFSSNPILAQMIESLLELYSFEQLILISFYDDRPRDYREHVEILEAIRSRESTRAHELMHRHLSDVRAVVENRQSRDEPGSQNQS